MSKDVPFGSIGDDLPKGASKVTVYVDAVNVEKQLQEVKGYQVKTSGASAEDKPAAQGGPENAFTFHVDEPPHLGGDNQYPQPLTYIAGGVAS
jgi:hypothetical protein